MRAAQRLQAAWLVRGGLSFWLLPVSWAYRALVTVRRALYRMGALNSETLPVPVVVVGNLIAGGAGKTPTTMAVVAALRRHGFTPGVISRGYGRQADTVMAVEPDTPATACGDEPLLMRLRTAAPVVVGHARVAAGRELLRLHPAVNVLVSDDGLQHLHMARQAQVIVFDERGAGNGWLLPAGPLREPVPCELPARSVVVYNSEAPSTPWPGHVAVRRLAGVVSLADWWRGEPATLGALAALAGRPVLATAGMARPQRFFDMLTAAGLRITPLPLPDHHNFAELPWPAATADVVLTEKDAVKLSPARMGSTRVWVATLDFSLSPAFDAALLSLLPAAPAVGQAT